MLTLLIAGAYIICHNYTIIFHKCHSARLADTMCGLRSATDKGKLLFELQDRITRSVLKCQVVWEQTKHEKK